MLKGRIRKSEEPSDKERIHVRHTLPADEVYLKKWLLAENTLRGFPMQNEAEVDDNLKMWMQYAKYGCALTAELEGEVVGGCVLYVHPYKKLAHACLFAIIVDDAKRGCGIGTQLLKAMIQYAKERLKIEQLHLEVYDGIKAFDLYKRMGFIEYGLEKDCLRDKGESIDKILMYKWI